MSTTARIKKLCCFLLKQLAFWWVVQGRLACGGLLLLSLSSHHLPICMVALRTSPLSDLHTSKTLASFHSLRQASSWTMTMSSTCTFRLGACHFCLRAIPARYSFLHLHQNCSDRYCTRLHLFLLYRSSLTNLPGGGSGTEDFNVSRWYGVSAS